MYSNIVIANNPIDSTFVWKYYATDIEQNNNRRYRCKIYDIIRYKIVPSKNKKDTK